MPQRLSSSSSKPRSEAYRLGRWFTAVRREGLLALVPAEVWHTLSALLSFTCRDGRREFSLDQLAVALGQSTETALARLEALARTEWRGQPLATLERDPRGEISGATLAPMEALSGARAPVVEEGSPSLPEVSLVRDDPEPDNLRSALEAVGLNPEQIDRLLRDFPDTRIRRQLDWLPQRQARNPAALLIRAIERDWSAPREAV